MSERFGFDAPKSQPIEDSIVWAAGNGFRYIDFQADVPPNAIASFDRDRVRVVRELCERYGVALGIHPSSAINNAEYVPIMAEAASEYLAANSTWRSGSAAAGSSATAATSSANWSCAARRRSIGCAGSSTVPSRRG